MADQLVFSPQSWTTSGHQLSSSGDAVAQASQSFLGAVSDSSVFGGNDLVGGTAALIYGLMVQRLGGCLDTLAEGFSAHGQMLVEAGQSYADLEQSQVDQAQSIEGAL